MYVIIIQGIGSFILYTVPGIHTLPELLGESDDDALRAADETEPVLVLVLGHFADELSAMGAQAREDVLDIVHGEHDATYAQGVRWCALRLSSDRRRPVELAQLNPTVAVWGPHHRDFGSNVLESNDLVHPTPLDCRLALQLHTKLDKERLRSLKVINYDENVVHPLKCHVYASHALLEMPAYAVHLAYNKLFYSFRISSR